MALQSQSVGTSTGNMGSSNTKNKGQSADYVEAIVCHESTLKENSMQVFEIGQEQSKVLVVKQDGVISALGTKCSHYGAPLNTGALGNGVVRCPWHGACFNTKTGDIEDFPGLDSIPCYQVTVEKSGNVKVKARKDLLEANKRIKEMVPRDLNNNTTYVVLGGGGAGACCVETLRQEGFSGRIVMITAENHLPYDRPKLSKMLDTSAAKISLRTPEFYEEHGIEVINGTEATGVDTNARTVKLNKGADVSYDKLFIATGSTPRVPELPGVNLENVLTLRTIVDANKIAEKSKGKKVVILGTSFIGMEVASYLCDKASSVTVVGRGAVPFAASLGPQIGERLKRLLEGKNVHFVMNNSIKCFIGGEGGEENLLKEVELENGEKIPADVCILGLGALPNTSFLEGSGINLESGNVVVNNNLETNISGVFAGGDIARAPLLTFASPVSDEEMPHAAIGHWQLANFHGRTAGCNMVNPNSKEVKTVPFFWTAIQGKSVRYAGHIHNYDDIVLTGDLDELKGVIAYYCRGEKVLAIATVNSDPVAAEFAERLSSRVPIMKSEVAGDDPLAWLTKK
ncbi:apoptosis-inducing factor 3 isoform X2 [Ischnura elegans]|uniref:apoptosis-inducing factor 3 isoform X2 n=1 Tax=Ischnura elegans TaxID=197161 RepID=UPI001ED86D28|nr:apoptosis-inducing factor 3 isoform X2 [Ischnura elegans]